MNYQIITDYRELKKFIEWLPEVNKDVKFLGHLMARKKYSPVIKSDQASLKRFVSYKKDLLEKIAKLEVPLGTYKFNGIAVPQEALAFYITVNPRDPEKVAKQLMKVLLDKVLANYDGYCPSSLALTAYHQTKPETVWYDFDFDGVKFEEMKDKIKEVVDLENVAVVETRGGFHLLVDVKKSSDTRWHQGLKKLGADVIGGSEALIPMPGTTQGGYTPRRIL